MGVGESCATPQSRARIAPDQHSETCGDSTRHTAPGRSGSSRRTPVRRDVVTWRRWRLLTLQGLLGARSREARALATIELGLYGAATVAAAARYRDPRQPLSVLLLIVAFPVLHFAYGTGMLLGLWRFRRTFPGWALAPDAGRAQSRGGAVSEVMRSTTNYPRDGDRRFVSSQWTSG